MVTDLKQALVTALPFVWFGAAAILIIIYPIYDGIMGHFHLNRVGREFCAQREVEFLGIKHAKAHFSVMHKEGGRKKYAKFRLHTSLGRLKSIEWLR